jgi:hypothetical protein
MILMRKKNMAWLAIAVAGWLSAPGIAAAEDQNYYGSGDGDNTGNVSDELEEVLNSYN